MDDLLEGQARPRRRSARQRPDPRSVDCCCRRRRCAAPSPTRASKAMRSSRPSATAPSVTCRRRRSSRNFIYWRGGSLSFGKLTMTGDRSRAGRHGSEGSLRFLRRRTGTISWSPAYSKTRPARGLKAHMPDYNDSEEQRVGNNDLMVPLSVLDLAPIVEGGTRRAVFRNSLDLAQHAERWGYRRYWLAEHHNMPGIASAATAVLIGHIGAGTSTIRIGAGGIMLPNHAPLQVAGAVRHARVAVSRPRRSGSRPRARHRSRRRVCAAPHAAGESRRISARRDRS